MFDSRNTVTPTHNHHHQEGYGNFYLDQEETVQFRPILTDEDDNSGICSPPLWKTTATTPSPNRSPSHPLLGPNNSYRSLSPNSRAQAIARGQMELMEMVKNMPESSYELSLKDIVEHRATESQLRGNLQQRGGGVVRRSNLESDEVSRNKKKKKNVGRNGSFDIETRGLFLNMFFPVSLKTKKNKEKDNSNNGKSVGSNNNNNSSVNGEKDWWKKKKFTASSDSESSKVSSNSGSSGSTASTASTGDTGSGGSGRSYGGRRKKGGLLRGCWPFFESRSRKSV